MARDQDGQGWWLELVVCSHSAASVCVAVEVVPNIHIVVEDRAGNMGWGQLKAQWQK